uniref:Pleckstrin homology domain containing O2 n=1 Tax=Piliocolobus tephrosceles TaxID=591936 RepID=A0A8C9IL01_9PRIM
RDPGVPTLSSSSSCNTTLRTQTQATGPAPFRGSREKTRPSPTAWRRGGKRRSLCVPTSLAAQGSLARSRNPSPLVQETSKAPPLAPPALTLCAPPQPCRRAAPATLASVSGPEAPSPPAPQPPPSPSPSAGAGKLLRPVPPSSSSSSSARLLRPVSNPRPAPPPPHPFPALGRAPDPAAPSPAPPRPPEASLRPRPRPPEVSWAPGSRRDRTRRVASRAGVDAVAESARRRERAAERWDLGGLAMEEEGVKEAGEKPRGAQTVDKAGWIKKSSGGLLGFWKDRYLLLCQAQLLVYENEDDQKCVETVELGSYEKCQDLRALLKRKHRFILLRSPGNKVSDIKFQAPTGEEKESWIKALNEGINRGKNKAFDEVKVDKSCALEHVTRDRVRGGQRRRPPTRVHLKEPLLLRPWVLPLAPHPPMEMCAGRKAMRKKMVLKTEWPTQSGAGWDAGQGTAHRCG